MSESRNFALRNAPLSWNVRGEHKVKRRENKKRHLEGTFDAANSLETWKIRGRLQPKKDKKTAQPLAV